MQKAEHDHAEAGDTTVKEMIANATGRMRFTKVSTPKSDDDKLYARHALQLHAEVTCDETQMRSVVSFYRRCLRLPDGEDESTHLYTTVSEMFTFSEDTIMGVMRELCPPNAEKIKELRESAKHIVRFNQKLLVSCFKCTGWKLPEQMSQCTLAAAERMERANCGKLDEAVA